MMKVLVDRDDVYKIVEKITNEAIEKHYHKITIQKRIIYELSTLKPIFTNVVYCPHCGAKMNGGDKA